MPKKKTVEPKRRTKVKDLPAAETKLTRKEMKKVKGGLMGDLHQPLHAASKKPITSK